MISLILLLVAVLWVLAGFLAAYIAGTNDRPQSPRPRRYVDESEPLTPTP